MGKSIKFRPDSLVHRVRIEYHEGGPETVPFSTLTGAREFEIRTQKLKAVKECRYISPEDWERLKN